MISIHHITFGGFGENTYILSDETGAAIIIDPGCYTVEENNELKNYIDTNELKVEKLLNTHCHIDHVLGNKFVKDTWKVDLLIHAIDHDTLRSVKLYAPMYGYHRYEETEPDGFLDDGDVFSFGSSSLDVIFVPGHAPGHIAFVHSEQKFCIGGDVLFQSSIGRTDLPGGDHNTLINSIHKKFFILPDDVVVYPGHGPSTTIGEERLHNPFCGTNARNYLY